MIRPTSRPGPSGDAAPEPAPDTNAMAAATPGAPSGYRPWLDGLRAVAIGLVLVEHAIGTFGMNFGGTGVGLFFALSGYLITGLLVDEWSRKGRISLRTFYWRRFARLVPALLLAVVVVNLGFIALRQSWPVYASLAALTYTTNYASIIWGQYLPGWGHTWSLAVEEHFYLAWPLVAILFLRRRGLRGLLTVALVLCVADIGWRAGLFSLDAPGRLFYIGSLERADALLYGCAAAIAVRLGWRPGWWALPVGVVLVAYHLSDHVWVPEIWNSTVMGIGGALVCVSVDVTGPRLVRGALSVRPLVWVGVMSYTIYLLHNPFITIANDVHLPKWGNGVAVMAAAFTAALSHRYLEGPVRSWARGTDIAHVSLREAAGDGTRRLIDLVPGRRRTVRLVESRDGVVGEESRT